MKQKRTQEAQLRVYNAVTLAAITHATQKWVIHLGSKVTTLEIKYLKKTVAKTK